MSFPSQIFLTDINHGYKTALLKKNSLWLLSMYMDVVSYCFYEKGRRRNALLKYFYSFNKNNNIQNNKLLTVKN